MQSIEICRNLRNQRNGDSLQIFSPPGSSSSIKSISVESVDSLAELRREKHAGNLSLSPLGERRWWRTKSKLDADEAKVKVKGHSQSWGTDFIINGQDY